jgi:hypothetical protein
VLTVFLGSMGCGHHHPWGESASVAAAIAANSSRTADLLRKRGSLMSPVSLGIVFCQAQLGRVVWQKSAYRPGLDGVDCQGPTADPPTRIG